MGSFRKLLLLCVAGLSLVTEAARAADEGMFLEKIQPPLEQPVGYGRSTLWTLPDVATQYRSPQPAPAMQAAMQAQQDGRFLEALILLEDALKSGQAGNDTKAEMNLLRTSFLLQGNQTQQALEILAPLLGNPRYAADAYALTAMAHLQRGDMQQALEAAEKAQGMKDGLLPHLALSYAMQGAGLLAEAREAMHGYNAQMPTQLQGSGAARAVALAREAELALTLGQPRSAKALVEQALGEDVTEPYVIAVSGLVYLVDGQANAAKGAFATALQRDPKDAKALLGLGLAEIKLGNFQAGLQKLRAAHEADPNSALILTYLGRAQQQSGDAAAARASWRRAQQLDPRDPAPWLYQAQAELQANRPLAARASLLEAQALTDYRSVYRGERLLGEDRQLLLSNFAEAQRQLGMEGLAFRMLADAPGEKDSASLRNQADVLQGQRFGESARRSLLLQSLFAERPGNLPSSLDIYGDGAGQTGATTPQHGVVSGLGAQQASYNNYDALFLPEAALQAEITAGSENSGGAQTRLGVGNDTLGISFAQQQFKTDGFARFDGLDNGVTHATVQWRPSEATQAFVTRQTFDSRRGETFFPGDPGNAAQPATIEDDSKVTRLGLRYGMTDTSEVRALWSHQQTGQAVDYLDPATGVSFYTQPGDSSAHGAELQYLSSGAGHATQWGAQQTRAQIIFPAVSDYTKIARQVYVARQQALTPSWQLDAQLGWGKIDSQDNLRTFGDTSTYLKRWLPRLGAVYTPDAGTHVRLAAWRNIGMSSIGDAALAPTTLAGFLLSRPGDNAQLVRAAALGADKQLGSAWLLEAQTLRRKKDDPSIVGGTQILFRQQIDDTRLALHWQSQSWTASLAYDHERLQAPPITQYLVLDSVQEQRLRAQRLALRWFAAEHWTANLAWSHNRVDGTLETNWFSTLLPYQDSFNQLDAELDWRFAKSGSLTAGVRNATDARFQYTDLDRLNPRFSDGRLVYARFKFAL